MAAHSVSGLKIQNNADINSFASIHHPRAVVYAELYFLYFIFLTEFSGAASCVAPASTSLAVENLLLNFILLVFNLTQFYFAVKDSPGAEKSPVILQPALLGVGLRWNGRCCSTLRAARWPHTIYCYKPSAHIIIT